MDDAVCECDATMEACGEAAWREMGSQQRSEFLWRLISVRPQSNVVDPTWPEPSAGKGAGDTDPPELLGQVPLSCWKRLRYRGQPPSPESAEAGLSQPAPWRSHP
jgi:hypothetical protein